MMDNWYDIEMPKNTRGRSFAREVFETECMHEDCGWRSERHDLHTDALVDLRAHTLEAHP